MNVRGLQPTNVAPTSISIEGRAELQLTLAEVSGQSFVHLVLGGTAILLDENHATALARLLDGMVAEIQARVIGR